MTRLIINADDLGLHPRIDEGIFRAHRDGVLTSATVLVTGATAAEANRRARQQGLAVGLHLCVSGGLPAAAGSAVPTLAPNGTFRRAWHDVVRAMAVNDVQREEVGVELRAQVARAKDLGVDFDHFDMHQHLHLFPGIRAEVEALATLERVPIRWPSAFPQAFFTLRPERFQEELGAWAKTAALAVLGSPRRTRVRHVRGLGVQQAGRLDERRLLAALEHVSGDAELGCHPGLNPGPVPEDPQWTYQWEAELEALCSPRVKQVIARRGIHLTTYRELFRAQPAR